MSRTFNVTSGLLFQCLSENVCTLGRANHRRQKRSCVCRSKHRYAELCARSNRAGAVGPFGMVSSDRIANVHIRVRCVSYVILETGA